MIYLSDQECCVLFPWTVSAPSYIEHHVFHLGNDGCVVCLLLESLKSSFRLTSWNQWAWLERKKNVRVWQIRGSHEATWRKLLIRTHNIPASNTGRWSCVTLSRWKDLVRPTICSNHACRPRICARWAAYFKPSLTLRRGKRFTFSSTGARADSITRCLPLCPPTAGDEKVRRDVLSTQTWPLASLLA